MGNNTRRNTFGGIVRLKEFDTEYQTNYSSTRSYWADKIASDHRFDRKCKRNIELRKRYALS